MPDTRRHRPPLRVAEDPAAADELDIGITVEEAARRLGCDQSTIRKMLTDGTLDGNHAGTGKRRAGIRVRLLSVLEHINKGVRNGTKKPSAAAPASPKPVTHAAHRESLVRLNKLGLLSK